LDAGVRVRRVRDEAAGLHRQRVDEQRLRRVLNIGAVNRQVLEVRAELRRAAVPREFAPGGDRKTGEIEVRIVAFLFEPGIRLEVESRDRREEAPAAADLQFGALEAERGRAFDGTVGFQVKTLDIP